MQTYQEIIKNLANEFQTRLEEKINSKERINNAIKGYLLLKKNQMHNMRCIGIIRLGDCK